MLHFASARAHGRNALFQLLLETDINVAFRDELYRTARDISIQANITENTQEIDRYVLHVATKGKKKMIFGFLINFLLVSRRYRQTGGTPPGWIRPHHRYCGRRRRWHC